MKKILALLASNSSTSINGILLKHACENIGEQQLTELGVGDYALPIFSEDIEKNLGLPHTVEQIAAIFAEQDAFIIACPEHNSSMPAVFKNFIDWLSRVPNDSTVFANKAVFLVSTSPGKRGGSSNLKHLLEIMPYWGADIKGSYSLGSFYEHYSDNNLDAKVVDELHKAIKQFVEGL
ncbi:NADPH-dependent FMN reductase [Agaribacterium haliotis]|uniref:NADPH-dependent FMN reductase n=1 Tax=Agaribacterium haliotis TaxID=2013869 RepID=UPI000BB55A3D|nr:NADPH-dependent FMN reductase [Agaribacterium haliotis]